jgi:hypothetical protein
VRVGRWRDDQVGRRSHGRTVATSETPTAPSGSAIASSVRQRTHCSESKNTSCAQTGQNSRFTVAQSAGTQSRRGR